MLLARLRGAAHRRSLRPSPTHDLAWTRGEDIEHVVYLRTETGALAARKGGYIRDGSIPRHLNPAYQPLRQTTAPPPNTRAGAHGHRLAQGAIQLRFRLLHLRSRNLHALLTYHRKDHRRRRGSTSPCAQGARRKSARRRRLQLKIEPSSSLPAELRPRNTHPGTEPPVATLDVASRENCGGLSQSYREAEIHDVMKSSLVAASCRRSGACSGIFVVPMSRWTAAGASSSAAAPTWAGSRRMARSAPSR